MAIVPEVKLLICDNGAAYKRVARNERRNGGGWRFKEKERSTVQARTEQDPVNDAKELRVVVKNHDTDGLKVER